MFRCIAVSALRMFISGTARAPAVVRRLIYDALPASHLVVKDSWGASFIVSTSDRVIGRQLFLTGQYDFWKLEKALAILDAIGHPRPRVLVDVGANIGSILIPALQRGLVESAIAIEPHPGNATLLRSNLELNTLSPKVDLVQAAASATSGDVMHLAESNHDGGQHQIAGTGVTVVSVRIDDVVPDPTNSLLWLDIEGHEGFALSGATAVLAQRAAVVAEFNPRYLRTAGGLDIMLQHLSGRRVFDLTASGHKETSFAALLDMYVDGETDILAVDPEAGHVHAR